MRGIVIIQPPAAALPELVAQHCSPFQAQYNKHAPPFHVQTLPALTLYRGTCSSWNASLVSPHSPTCTHVMTATHGIDGIPPFASTQVTFTHPSPSIPVIITSLPPLVYVSYTVFISVACLGLAFTTASVVIVAPSGLFCTGFASTPSLI